MDGNERKMVDCPAEVLAEALEQWRGSKSENGRHGFLGAGSRRCSRQAIIPTTGRVLT